MQPQNQPTIDGNSVSAGLGSWFNRVYGVLRQAYADVPVQKAISINPSGNKLRIEIIPRTLSATAVPDRMPIDANSKNVDGGLTNDSSRTLKPLSVDVIQGVPALRIDATILP